MNTQKTPSPPVSKQAERAYKQECVLMDKTATYCIQWTTQRERTHSGPELWVTPDQTDCLHDLTQAALSKIPKPRPKTLEEAQELTNTMNRSPEFNNNTHEVIEFKPKKKRRSPNNPELSDTQAPQVPLTSTTTIFPSITQLKETKTVCQSP